MKLNPEMVPAIDSEQSLTLFFRTAIAHSVTAIATAFSKEKPASSADFGRIMHLIDHEIAYCVNSGGSMAASLAIPLQQFSARPSIDIDGRVELMLASGLFAGLPRPVCEQLAIKARPKVYERDELIYMQGEPVRHLVLIRTGAVKITQLASNGNEVILWMYGKGTAIGLFVEPTTCCYSNTARAIEKSTALVWDFATLQGYMQDNERIRINSSQILTSRLNELEERFREVATEKVASRVASALFRLLKHIGREVKGGIEVSLSREELAQMTGTTLFTISRLMSRWSEMGIVSPRREAILVHNPHWLEIAQDEGFGKSASRAHGSPAKIALPISVMPEARL